MRYATKQALLQDIRDEHAALISRLDQIPKARLREMGVWGNAWTAHDLVAHLAEWQNMFLTWYDEGAIGLKPQMPAPGYKWNETPKLNQAIREKHKSRTPAKVRTDFDQGYERILEIANRLTEKQLLCAGAFAWTGKNALVTYLSANSASHYRFANKVLKKWLKAISVPRGN
jgi:hypothetical protein